MACGASNAILEAYYEWDLITKVEFYMKSALKLLRLHNETLEAVSRYRRGGEQKVIVQHVNVNNGSQAIVGALSAREGG